VLKLQPKRKRRIAMEQMTLWELQETTELVTNPIWQQLDPVVKMDMVTRLSRLMTKAVNPNRNEMQNKQENNHD
jgi:hypothetical protein